MTLGIDSERITQVLLADGWHSVAPGTFYTDAYEYHDGDADGPGWSSFRGEILPGYVGCSWVENNSDKRLMFAPMSAVLAVSYPQRAT